MNNKENKNTEFEKLLKEKMDGLASSVDCFDKISRKAFPKTASVSDGEGYTVSELENITGKTKRFRFLPVMAAAAAFVLCLFFLPKSSGFMNFLYANIGKSDKRVFTEIINELNDEQLKYDYVSFDCPLDEYIENDVIITPFMECPFEKNEKKDLNVRLFVKMCGNVPTNQIYAVVYEGSYLDENFIAAADSSAKYSEKELAALPEIYSLPLVSDTVYYNNGIIGADKNSFTDINGSNISLGGFDYECYYKNDSNISLFNSDICYYTLNDSHKDSVTYYDIRSYFKNESTDFTQFDCFTASEIYNPEKMWNNVVYFSGDSAKSKNELSGFERTRIFSDKGDLAVSSRISLPYNSDTDMIYGSTYLTVTADNGLTGEIPMPPLSSLFRTFKIYHPNEMSSYTYENSDRDISETADFKGLAASDAQKQQLSCDIEYAEIISSEIAAEIEVNSQIEKALKEEALKKQLEETERYLDELGAYENISDSAEIDYSSSYLIPKGETVN